MEATIPVPADEATRALERELETWDFARTAGVSAEDLRQALRAMLGEPELRRAA